MEFEQPVRRQIALLKIVKAEFGALDAEAYPGEIFAVYAEVNKDLRMAEIGNQKNNNAVSKAISPQGPSESQIELLKKNNKPIPATKAEAHKVIAEMIASWNKE